MSPTRRQRRRRPLLRPRRSRRRPPYERLSPTFWVRHRPACCCGASTVSRGFRYSISIRVNCGRSVPRVGMRCCRYYRNVVIFDGDNGSSVVSAIGATSTENLGPGVYPVVERDSRKLWVLSDDVPRRWQLRAVDGTILDVLPFESNVAPVAFSDRAVMLVSIQGTSLFDLVTRRATDAHVGACNRRGRPQPHQSKLLGTTLYLHRHRHRDPSRTSAAA